MADVADLVKVSEAIDNVDEGFIAWMAVSPRLAYKSSLARELVGQVFRAMRLRNFKQVWLSWELHNGEGRMTEAEFQASDVTARLVYQLYRFAL